MIMPQHTKFGNEKFSIKKISSVQIFTGILNLHCDLTPEHSNQNLSQDTPAYDDAQ